MKTLFCTSVGKKFLLGLTGIGVSGFAFLHMTGNLLLLVGPELYNEYALKLSGNKALYYGGEVVLLALFLSHIGLALSLARENRAARGVKPASSGSGEKQASLASRSMVLSGLVVLVFLIMHLQDFRFGTHYSTQVGAVEARDLYRLVAETFANPVKVGLYVFAVLVLGLHMSHGIGALFQSLGCTGVREKNVKRVAYAVSFLIAAGFLSQPLYLFLNGAR